MAARKVVPDQPKQAKTEHYRDHRQRMRRKLEDHGGRVLHDYEILEMLLYQVNRRGDTKPPAKALLEKFGSLRAVFAASVSALEAVEGIGRETALFLTLLDAALCQDAWQKMREKPVLTSWQAVTDYCREEIGYKPIEYFIVLYLNARNRVIDHRQPDSGTVSRVSVYPREIVRESILLNASAVILVHNHPSGELTPSRDDIAMTDRIATALASIDVQLHDHLIVNADHHVSFKYLGLL